MQEQLLSVRRKGSRMLRHEKLRSTLPRGGAEQDASTKEDASEAQKYPASFNAIVNLIATGQEDKIPGVRNIPLIINQEKPSESKMERPKKPWE